MKSIAPALGPGLGVGAAGEESRRGGEKGEGRADVPPLDDVVGYAPALLLSEGSQDDALAQRRAEQQHSPCTLWPRHLHNRRRVRTPTPHLSVAFGLTCWLRLGQMVSFIREGGGGPALRRVRIGVWWRRWWRSVRRVRSSGARRLGRGRRGRRSGRGVIRLV